MSTREKRCRGLKPDGTKCMAWATGDDGYCNHHPGDIVRKSEFAALQGFSPQYVSELLRDGVIDETEEGFINRKEAAAALAMKRDPGKAMTRKGTPHEDAILPGDISDESESIHPMEIKARYSVAQMREKEEKALREEIARLEDEGRLIPVEDVEADAEDAALKLKAMLMVIPDQLAPKLASMTDAKKIHVELTKRIRRALEEISSEFTGGDDLAS